MRTGLRPLAACMLLALSGGAACAAAVPLPWVKALPNDLGTPPGPVNAAPLDLALYGYTEHEYLISGSTNTYREQGDWGTDGQWSVGVASAHHPYTTRILVRRPTDPARFNGTVVVEWLNVTSGYDLDVDWPQSYPEFLRDGFAWVGVSAQKIGVNALRRIDPERYATLRVDSDDQSYDIFSQAANAVLRESWITMGGLHVKRVIATGQSQSAIRLVTYANAIQPIAQVFSGLMIHSRSSGAAPVGLGGFPPAVVHIRSDSTVPILQLQSQTDVSELAFYKARQPDTPLLRTWEVAGASHVDANFLTAANAESAAALGAPPVSCLQQVNSVPFRYVENAAWAALQDWVAAGTPPPASPQIEVTDTGQVVTDADGNALGGIRLPELQVPVATYTMNNFGRLNAHVPNGLDYLGCSLLGSTLPFSRSKLDGLYPSHDGYVAAYAQAAQALVQQGFMLPPDQALANLRAQQSDIGGP